MELGLNFLVQESLRRHGKAGSDSVKNLKIGVNAFIFMKYHCQDKDDLKGD
jgi:hypothetical protein